MRACTLTRGASAPSRRARRPTAASPSARRCPSACARHRVRAPRQHRRRPRGDPPRARLRRGGAARRCAAPARPIAGQRRIGRDHRARPPLPPADGRRSSSPQKEGLALINGSPCAAALVADAALAADAPARAGVRRLRALGRGVPGAARGVRRGARGRSGAIRSETAALRALRRRLVGADADPGEPTRPRSASASSPRVLGQAERSLEAAREAARHVARARSPTTRCSCRPRRQHPRGRVLSTGGYHNSVAPQALNGLAADLGRPRAAGRATRRAALDRAGQAPAAAPRGALEPAAHGDRGLLRGGIGGCPTDAARPQRAGTERRGLAHPSSRGGAPRRPEPRSTPVLRSS